MAVVTTNHEVERGDPVLWMIPILIVAVAYEAFDAANRFAALAPRNVLRRKNNPRRSNPSNVPCSARHLASHRHE